MGQGCCQANDAMDVQVRSKPTEDGVKAKYADKKFVFVMGGPGCGKGTQCGKIVEEFGYTHLSTGDLFRAELKTESEVAKKCKAIISEGKLVSMELTVEVLLNGLNASESKTGVFLIDGFPRALDQADYFEKNVADVAVVLAYDVPAEIMTERILKRGETSGRADDNAETCKKRVDTYIEESMPVIEHFKTKGKASVIDATGSVDEVYAKT